MFQKLSINQKFLVLVLVVGAIFTAAFVVLNRVTGEIQENWVDYRDQIAERQKDLMAIKSQFGYGGGIHSFKNYVLRKNPTYFERTLKQLDQVSQTIATYYQIRGITEQEIKALAEVQGVFDKYKEALLEAQSMFAQGRPSNEVDDAIKIDDTPALDAFIILENIYDDMTHRTTRKIGDSISRGLNSLIGSLSFAFVVIVIFSIIIARSMTKPLEEALEAAKKSQKDLERAREAAEAANLAKSTFLANMSHEIRTPMNAILGYSQIMIREGDLNKKQMSGIENINKGGTHLLSLINDILDISKIESGAMELNKTDFGLENMIEWTSSMFQVRCEEKRLGWHVERSSDCQRTVRGDEGKLKQVLINLLGNAVKFTKKGRITLKVQKLEGDSYRFEVEDTGPGIDSFALKAIFTPFRQESAGRQEGGTGLGLAISKKQIELMGGKLGVDSQFGHGSKFYFSIELPASEETVQVSSQATGPDVLRLAPGYSVRALVVDDNRFNRDVLSNVLTSINAEVEQANNGKIAVEMAQEKDFDIIFMDMRMPVMRGEEAVTKIQEKLGKDKPKIVAITASVFSHQKNNFLELGCHDFISKPFELHQVFDALKELLGLEYEYKEAVPDTDRANAIPEVLDFSELKIPVELYTQLKGASELYQITEIETALQKLEQSSGDGRALAKHMQAYVARYDMEGILEVLGKVNND